MSQDPLGFGAGDSNLYRYVNNQPTTTGDPSGMDPSDAPEWFKQAVKQRNDQLIDRYRKAKTVGEGEAIRRLLITDTDEAWRAHQAAADARLDAAMAKLLENARAGSAALEDAKKKGGGLTPEERLRYQKLLAGPPQQGGQPGEGKSLYGKAPQPPQYTPPPVTMQKMTDWDVAVSKEMFIRELERDFKLWWTQEGMWVFIAMAAGGASLAKGGSRPNLGPTSVENRADDITAWLGPRARVIRDDPRSFVIQSEDGWRQFRIDVENDGSSHAHLEVIIPNQPPLDAIPGLNRGSPRDAIPGTHRIPFKP
jgi:hypothetical protein